MTEGSLPIKLPIKQGEKIATLDRLRAAGRMLFVARGYHETRPQDIARAAGVANGTFYLHFADKQQAFLDFAEQAQNELLSVMNGELKTAKDARARWRVICGTAIDFDAAHPGLLQAAFMDPVFVAPSDDNAWRMYDRLGQLLAITLAGEHPDPDINYELISHGLCGMLRHAMIYAGRRKIAREEIIRDLSGFIDRGLGVIPGRQE